MALIQFIVLKRKGKWAVKSVDQEVFFSSQREALHAAIELANDCGKDGKPLRRPAAESEKQVRYHLDLWRECISPLQVRRARALRGIIAVPSNFVPA